VPSTALGTLSKNANQPFDLHQPNSYQQINVSVSGFDVNYSTSNVTSNTGVRSASAHLFASMWQPNTPHHYYVAIIIHHRAWHRMLSLRYACIQSPDIIIP